MTTNGSHDKMVTDATTAGRGTAKAVTVQRAESAGWTKPQQMWFSSVRSGAGSISISGVSEARVIYGIALRLNRASVVLARFGLGGSAPAEAGKGAAIAGGIIAGAAIGAAISSSVNQPKTVVAVPRPGHRNGSKCTRRSRTECNPAQRACYNANGAYNANWTYKIYAR
jgi:hypothetical protein